VSHALRARVDALEAERLAPVPRASRAIAVDAEDVALLLGHVKQAPPPVWEAYWRLEKAVRGCLGPGYDNDDDTT
jgi:hypothetical protein